MKERNTQAGFVKVLLLLLLFVGIATGLYLVAQRTNLLPQASISKQSQVNNIQQKKNLITVQISNYLPVDSALTRNTTFNSYDPTTKQTKEFLKFQGDTVIHEAAVAPDGQKLYYISSSLLGFPNTITNMDSNGSKKEYQLAQDNLWTLSNPGNLEDGRKKDCYWSPDSSKLACMLIQRESPTGAGTGRINIIVLDYGSGNQTEALNSDQIAQPNPAVVDMIFSGWAGNNKLLVVHTANNNASLDIQPADFYIVDITTKTPQKEFSYQYGGGDPVAATPTGDKVFVDSFSRVNEEKLVLYDFATKQFSTILSSKDTLSISSGLIIPSEDGSKMIYNTVLDKQIHIYDLETNKETTINNDQPISSVQALLSDNKTFVVGKSRENSALFDNTTQQYEDLKGVYIGSGNF